MQRHGITMENGKYRVSGALLLMFSAPFIVWQMGVMYFSGTTMSLFGRTPVPLSDGSTALVIAAGYAASIAFICAFPEKCVLAERALLPAALVATALMLLPLAGAAITVLFNISAFVCVFSIGALLSTAARLFTVQTTWRDGIISMVAGGTVIAVLQNDFFTISFTAFMALSVLLLAALTAFFYIIPAKAEATSAAAAAEKRAVPDIPFFGLWTINAFSTLMICFASSFAESVKHGTSVLYLSAAVFAALLYFIARKRGVRSVKTFGLFFMSSALGFVCAYASLGVPALALVACALLGFVAVLANLWMFFAAAACALYPLRRVGALGAAMGLALAALHSGLLNMLRDNLRALFAIYAVLSVVLIIIYYLLEPYLARVWEKQAPQTAATAKPELGAAPFDVLSEQERTLTQLLLAGYTEGSIARQMNISLNTQKSYRKNVYAKLDVHTKAELFALSGK